jgi:hypothetical protein
VEISSVLVVKYLGDQLASPRSGLSGSAGRGGVTNLDDLDE